jgi:pimeloyl-ACP methyl ester carboxylesterase
MNGIIVINYPGFGGDIDGYRQKYKRLAGFVQDNVGAVARLSNVNHPDLHYSHSCVNDLRAVVEYVCQHGVDICGAREPRIFIMAISAGGSAAAVIAHEFPGVERLLLVAPSDDAGFEAIASGLRLFCGQLFIAVGKQDEVVGTDLARQLCSLADKASSRRLEIIDGCDHMFMGRRNGRILSSLPMWAFRDDAPAPSEERGIDIYD